MFKGITVSPREKTIVPFEEFEEFRDHRIVLLAFQIVIDREIFVISFCNIRLGKWKFAEFEFVTTIVVFGIDILLRLKPEESQALGYYGLQSPCSLVLNDPFSRLNRKTPGCANQPLLISPVGGL